MAREVSLTVLPNINISDSSYDKNLSIMQKIFAKKKLIGIYKNEITFKITMAK